MSNLKRAVIYLKCGRCTMAERLLPTSVIGRSNPMNLANIHAAAYLSKIFGIELSKIKQN